MFEITDEFLTQAGFTTLSEEQKTTLKAQVAQSVERKIGERIVHQIGEDKAKELSDIMEGDASTARKAMENIDAHYQESTDFKSVEELGKANSASDDEIVKEYATIAYMKHHGVDIAHVVQESMNDAMLELSTIYKQAVEATTRHQ